MIIPREKYSTLADISCVFFDMDGTLLDSAPGVTSSAASALRSVGAPVPSPEELLRFVGPPMIESFRTVSGLDEASANEALRHYRKAYADYGAEKSSLYDGVFDLLKTLRSAGIPMAVATSKVEDQAIRLAREFAIEEYFEDICGASDVEGRSNKEEVCAELLHRLASKGIDISNPIMVGDRSFDVVGAAAHKISTIFVPWGYGDEIESLGSVAIASSPKELMEMILEAATGK